MSDKIRRTIVFTILWVWHMPGLYREWLKAFLRTPAERQVLRDERRGIKVLTE